MRLWGSMNFSKMPFQLLETLLKVPEVLWNTSETLLKLSESTLTAPQKFQETVGIISTLGSKTIYFSFSNLKCRLTLCTKFPLFISHFRFMNPLAYKEVSLKRCVTNIKHLFTQLAFIFTDTQHTL